MKFFAVVVLINFASCSCVLRKAEMDNLWGDFKMQFKKYYSKSDEFYRRSVWENHILDIVNHNMKANLGLFTFYKGVNEYSDLTLAEHKNLLMGIKVKNYNPTTCKWRHTTNVSLPENIDWRKQGLVTEVKNQGTCGSCWAFSTTGALEGQHKRKTGQLISLSEQNLIDCSEKNDGCNGGSIDDALDYIKTNSGIDTEVAYPYEAKNNSCRFQKSSVGATCHGRVDLPPGDEEALKQAVASVGPISVIIDACHNSFISYKSGIFDEPQCRTDIPSHAVLVVGYGTNDGNDYWLVKNSWGESWGMHGYIQMSRNKGNQCGIASRATYPLV